MMGLISGFGSSFDFSDSCRNCVPWHAIAQPETAEHGRTRPRHRNTGGDVRPSVVVVIVDVDIPVLGRYRRQPRCRGHILEDRVAFAVQSLVEVQAHGRNHSTVGRAGVVFGNCHVGAPVTVDVPNRDAGVEVGPRAIGVGCRSYQTRSLGPDLPEGPISLGDEQAVGANHVEIAVTVASEVLGRNPEAFDVGRQARRGGRVGELEPTLVAQKAALAALEAVLGDEQVEQPIGVVVQYGYGAAPDIVATVGGNGTRDNLEAASVVAQSDALPGSRLVVGFFLVSRYHEILVAIIVQIGESEPASPPVGLWERCIYSKPVGAADGELVGLERTACVTQLDEGIVVGESAEEEVERSVVIDVAPRYPMPKPVLGYLISYAFLVRYIGEGYLLRSRGSRWRHPTSGLLGDNLGNVSQCSGTGDRCKRQAHHDNASGQSRKRTTDRLNYHTNSLPSLPRHLLSHASNHTTREAM